MGTTKDVIMAISEVILPVEGLNRSHKIVSVYAGLSRPFVIRDSRSLGCGRTTQKLLLYSYSFV